MRRDTKEKKRISNTLASKEEHADATKLCTAPEPKQKKNRELKTEILPVDVRTPEG